MPAINAAGFERKFQRNLDPWNYTHSAFERFKREVFLRACGPAKRGRVLELGCAIGETTQPLARRSLRLLAVDASPTALREAARRCAKLKNVTFCQSLLPQQMPRGPFDLIVVSELVYYMPSHHLSRLADRIETALAPGGDVVVLDHRRPFDDAAVLPSLAHCGLRRRFARSMRLTMAQSYRDFEIFVFRKHHRPRSTRGIEGRMARKRRTARRVLHSSAVSLPPEGR
jgi:SAM-dependent methyltransferase